MLGFTLQLISMGAGCSATAVKMKQNCSLYSNLSSKEKSHEYVLGVFRARQVKLQTSEVRQISRKQRQKS